MFAFSLNINAQTFWSVDFETSDTSPEGWTVINHNTAEDGQWVFNNPGSKTFFSSTADNGFAIIDSDFYSWGKHQNTDLISPKIELSNHSNVNISFDHHFKKAYGNGDTCRFSARINSGEWVLLQMWASETVEESFNQALSEALSFSENDSIQLKFNYVGSFDNYWSLDNIRLFEPSAMQLSEAIQSNTPNEFGMIGGKLIMSELKIKTDGSLSPISNLNIYGNIGETEVLSDVEKIMIYKDDATEATAKVGETNIENNSFNVSINSTLELTNTFYLVYQLSTTATENDSIDIAIDSIVASNGSVIPDMVNLPGMKYVKKGMQGTYIISTNNNDNPDYDSISKAIVDLNEKGIQDNVIFEIQAGTYDEFITIERVSGVDEDKTITFKGMGSNPDATILTSNAGNIDDKATVILNNARHIRFENLTITSSSTSNATLVRLENTYKDLRFNQIKFIGLEVTSSSYSNDKHLVYDKSEDAVDKTLHFDDCDFINGYIALYLQGKNFISPYDKDIKINNNRFTGQYSKSVFIKFTEAVEITHNDFENSKDLVNEFTNIDLFNCKNGVNIESNSIVNNLENKRSIAISCRPCVGTDEEPVLIINNMIKNKTNYSGYSHAIDIDGNGAEYIYILNNTISMKGTSSKLNGIFIEKKTEHLRIENNLIANSSSEGILMWIRNKNIENKTIDYNRYEYASSTFGKYKFDEITTFSEWQDSLNQETHSDSISLSNLFVSENNLHLIGDENLRVENPLSLVPLDIDGQTRSTTTPCAGADEYEENLPPYLTVAFETVKFEMYPQTKTVGLSEHFADPNGDEISFELRDLSSDKFSASIVNDTILNLVRESNDEALNEWVKIATLSGNDSLITEIPVKLLSTDQAPLIQNQIAEQNFSTYPETITVDISNAFTDPDNEDSEITYEAVSFDANKYNVTLNETSMDIVRNTPTAFTNDTLVLRANSNGKHVDMDILISAIASPVEPLVADFEEMPLNADSIWSAPAMGDNYFVDKTWRFYNFSASGYWGGFQVSSRKDTTTTAMDAQYTAVTGSGYNNSEQYNVSYASYYPTDVFPETGNPTETVKGMYVTNNLWTYQVIMNGDNYTNAFGGESGNDPDYFRIRAIGYNENDEAGDTVYFYLADYRFEDNTQDYVVTDWQYFDLSSLGEVSKIRFSVEGSKQNEYGLVTPAYFCMDNFNDDAPVVDLPPVVISDTSLVLAANENEISLNLLDLVSDPDNDDTEIVFSFESGNDANIADFSITDSILTIERNNNNQGETTLVIKALSNGQSVTFEIPVTIEIYNNMNDFNNNSISCYPNPCTDNLYINYSENGNYQIIAVNGAVVLSGKIYSNQRNKIDVSNLKSGMYQLIIRNKQTSKHLKFIRQ